MPNRSLTTTSATLSRLSLSFLGTDCLLLWPVRPPQPAQHAAACPLCEALVPDLQPHP